jgi:hypothetical protein
MDTVTAIYWPQRTAEFSPDMLDADYVHSPLTDKLIAATGADCYLKLASHLYGLSRGARRPLAGVSQRKAWRYLAEVNPALVIASVLIQKLAGFELGR